ncbi:MAG: mandelate racemase/muconate lactonizing enzyme family protein [Clostridiales bacterium]|nr:mandelate racemase/muconate lactonizing enzyme family protein [Clostridiales bacterium]
MKVIRMELIPASKYLFIKLHTDEGITGIGEVGAWGYLDGTIGVLKKLEGYIVGQNPMRIEHHWQYMYRSMYFRGSIIMSAISAIDIALWDIKGKALGVPVYELLGGKCRDKVRTYPAVFKFTPEEMAEECKKVKEQGFTAARLMITGDIRKKTADFEDGIFSHRVAMQIARVKACRDAVGDDFDLILEVHRSMNPMDAIAFAKGVEEYHPLFLEDPIPPDNNAAMAELASKTWLPIASGERFINIEEFEDLLSRHGARYVRPDVCALGGLTPCKKVAAIAESHYVEIVPHNPLGPVSTAACLQLDAAVPNVCIQEFPSFYLQGNESQMIKSPLELDHGYLVVPDAPGIGIELADDISEKFPPAQRSISCQIAFDGSVRDV